MDRGSVALCVYCAGPCDAGAFSLAPVWACAWCRAHAHVACYQQLHAADAGAAPGAAAAAEGAACDGSGGAAGGGAGEAAAADGPSRPNGLHAGGVGGGGQGQQAACARRWAHMMC